MQPSSSDAVATFDSLAEPVRRWIYAQGWPSLRDIQKKAIPVLLAGGDAILTARTAAGKTEAAFLPLVSRILQSPNQAGAGFDILYVSPLKALINDQHRRLESLLETCDIPLHKWHGDVSSDAKQKARTRPSGVVLITPESLEATLLHRGREVETMFSALNAIVIDELHAFIGRERGIQLQSILTRIEVACGGQWVDRVGLSATLGDMTLAAEYLRPGHADDVQIVTGNDEGNGLKLQIRGYAEERVKLDADGKVDSPVRQVVNDAVANDMFRLLRGKNNLLFGGSRQRVEAYTDALRGRCENNRLPNEFFAHHGSLSKAEREDVEDRLRHGAPPTTAVATTTLELGIDVGDVASVAQLGPGFSVSSLRQRLGRSGRRPGNPAVLRMFVIEEAPEVAAHPVDRLRLDLIQSIALVECMLKGWCEPPDPTGLHLSTLIHQTLAIIVQTGAIRPVVAHKILCELGPFRSVDRDMYAGLLRGMAHAEPPLIEMRGDEMMLAEGGENLTAGHDFYPVFETPVEYRVMTSSRTLGTLPIDHVVAPGQTLIFGGRRWRAISVDDRARAVLVEPTHSALPPTFGGDWGGIHDRVVDEMKQILGGTEVPVYLDEVARPMLDDAREAFFELGLDRRSILQTGNGVYLFPWVGSRRLDTLSVALLARNFEASVDRHSIEIDNCAEVDIRSVLEEISREPPPPAEELTREVSKPYLAKFDRFLTEPLLSAVVAQERLDIPSLPLVAMRCLRN